MYKLIEVLNVDANYLFQDVVNIPKKINDVTFSEFEHIKKYRALDDRGKDIVDTVLEKEYQHSNKENDTPAKITDSTEKESYQVAARGNANARIDKETAKELADAAENAPNLADKGFL